MAGQIPEKSVTRSPGSSYVAREQAQLTSESGTRSWRAVLEDQIPEALFREIDVFAQQMELRRKEQADEKIFAELRLRRGMYGQRYDNGQRHDGVKARTLEYPSGQLTKGPNTAWDAPGMLRIKIPFGHVDARQLETMAELADEYADGILHVTTRQDVQLHFVHLDDGPDMMRRLAAVGITTQEACGNSVRNVTCCPLAGVCGTEPFDVTPHSKALAYFLLGHPEAQDFGRKFKISFSGCAGSACGLAHMHDLGFVAQTRTVTHPDGSTDTERGFAVYMGGGLGAVPHQAKLFDDFVPESEILPLAQATCRVFARLGEKKNRARARLKFLVAKLGFDEFKRLVLEERPKLSHDPQWTAFLDDLQPVDAPNRDPAELEPAHVLKSLGPIEREPFDDWRVSNCEAQRQTGFSTVAVNVPLGDLTADQVRGLADIARRFTGDAARFSVEQNLVLRWVSNAYLPIIYRELSKLGLATPGAGTIVDITACPGTDTCKLGTSSSRGLAVELRERLAEQNLYRDKAVKNLRIKISGCFNACGQHHISDIGFLGVSRKVNGFLVPHFQLVLGGQWSNNAGSFGLAIGAVPSKKIPETVSRVTSDYAKNREHDESFQRYVARTGKPRIRAMLADLLAVPTPEEDASFYTDWGDARRYSTDDKGVGECAGEVISAVDFGLQESEREVFAAQEHLDKFDARAAADGAYRAMLNAAKTLVRAHQIDIPDDADVIVAEFREHLHDTQLFHDPFAGAKFARYFFSAHTGVDDEVNAEQARQRIEEAQLFVEAAHSYYARMNQS